MIAASDLQARARGAGIDLIPDGDGLRIRSPKGAMPPDLRAAIIARKAELLVLLGGRPDMPPADPTPSPAPAILPPHGWRGPYSTVWGTVAFSAPGAEPLPLFGPPPDEMSRRFVSTSEQSPCKPR